MRLTTDEIEYTRQVAAEIGADPDELIREGEALNSRGSLSTWAESESAPGAEPRTYITQVWTPAADDGAIRIHSGMPDPEPLPDPEPEIEPELEL